MKLLDPVYVNDLFAEEREALLTLLESLTPEQWRAPTVCAGWSVQDIAAHIVGDDLSVVSGATGGGAWIDASSWNQLLVAINAQNELWVAAMRRLSGPLICELLRFSGAKTFAHYRSRDLHALGVPVDWAGPGPAPAWLHIAREYTERWLHQAQIRDALSVPALSQPRLFAPVLDAFARALPHTYRDVAAAAGTHVRVEITGDAGGGWSLVRGEHGWALWQGVLRAADATVTLPQDIAWRAWTKGLTPDATRAHAAFDGNAALGEPVLAMVSILA